MAEHLVDADAFPASVNAQINRWRRTGTTMKVNLALDRLPRFRCRRDWAIEEPRDVRHLIDIANRFAPGLATSVTDVFSLTPPGIERHFGIRYGHIHHIDNTFGFDQRMPYRTPIAGLYSCSAGCHPAGSVIGAAGHNAANCMLADIA